MSCYVMSLTVREFHEKNKIPMGPMGILIRFSPLLSGNNAGQVVRRTRVTLSASSIICYWPKNGDAQRVGTGQLTMGRTGL